MALLPPMHIIVPHAWMKGRQRRLGCLRQRVDELHDPVRGTNDRLMQAACAAFTQSGVCPQSAGGIANNPTWVQVAPTGTS